MSEAAQPQGQSTRRLAATFSDPQAAQRAADLVSMAVPQSTVEVGPKNEEPAVKYAEMRDELEGVVASPALGTVMTSSQTQGALGGGLLGGGIGLAIGALIGFFMHGMPGGEVWWVRWILTWALIPAVAGGTLGMMAGGLLKSRYRPASKDTAPSREASPRAGIESPKTTVVTLSTDDDRAFEKAIDTLQELQPLRLDQFDAGGEVVTTQSLGDGSSS